MKEKTDITIFCLTYNHAEYIRDAFKGFLSQITNYNYNVFVYDDASTDGTSDIVREYEKKYPEIFDVYISDVNMYNSPERISFMRKLYRNYIKGEYVAWCEGDDYWADRHKLQKQVDYMRNNESCMMTAHASMWIDYQKNAQYEKFPYETSRVLLPEEVIMQRNGNLPTASLVMKKEVFIQDEVYPTCEVADIPMQLYAIAKGYIYYFSEVMSVYRYMHDGSWCANCYKNDINLWKHRLRMVFFYEGYDRYTKGKYHQYIVKKQNEFMYTFTTNDKEITLLGEEIKQAVSKELAFVVDEQINYYRMLNEKEYIADLLKKELGSKAHIVIMGTGDYGKRMFLKFNAHSIMIDGFVVSNNKENTDFFENKPVWRLRDYPYDWNETMVVVAVNKDYRSEIEKSLEENAICYYVAPYWIGIRKNS